MTSTELLDSRKFVNLMNMCVSVWARKRPRPSDTDLAEAFEPVLAYIKAQEGLGPQTALEVQAAAKQTELGLGGPLTEAEKIKPTPQEQIDKEAATPLNQILSKIHLAGQKATTPTFSVYFDRNEGMHLDGALAHLEVAKLPYYVNSKTFGMPSAFEEGASYTPGGWTCVFGKK